MPLNDHMSVFFCQKMQIKYYINEFNPQMHRDKMIKEKKKKKKSKKNKKRGSDGSDSEDDEKKKEKLRKVKSLSVHCLAFLVWIISL